MALVAALVLGMSFLCSPPPAAGESSLHVFSPEVKNLDDPDAVVETMLENGASELPIEAIAWYRRGIDARNSGDTEKAEAAFLVATRLDHAFPEAHLALARLRLFHDPRMACEDLGRASIAAVASFESQHLLLVNIILGSLALMAISFLVLVTYAGFRHLPRVHHSLAEYFQLWFSGPLASVLAILILLTPFLWRIGLFPGFMAFLGLMWAWMRPGERRWVAALGAPLAVAPLLLWLFSPILLSPLDPAERPFLLSRAMASPHSPGVVRALENALENYPEDPALHFALATSHKRGGEVKKAKKLYQKALELGAPESAVQNNLGVIAFLYDDFDEAMDLLQKSVASNPDRAASHFNLSQAYAKKLYFEKADQELLMANKLSFNSIRATLRHSEGDDRRTLIDEPLTPMSYWQAAWASPRRMPGLPGWLSYWFPGSLWVLPWVALGSFFLAGTLGRRLHLNLRSFDCTNCHRPVCRRCLRRIRRQAYCSPCGDALLRIQSSSYSKLILDSQIRRKRRGASIVIKATNWLLPGLCAARLEHFSISALLVLAGVGSGLAFFHHGLPFSRLVWIEDGNGPWWPEIPFAVMALVLICTVVTIARLKPVISNDDRADYDFETDEEPVAPDQEERAA